MKFLSDLFSDALGAIGIGQTRNDRLTLAWIRALGLPRPKRISRADLILSLLADGPTTGLDLVKRSGGRLKRGVIYVTLDDMERRGLIESWAIETEYGPSRVYRLGATQPPTETP